MQVSISCFGANERASLRMALTNTGHWPETLLSLLLACKHCVCIPFCPLISPLMHLKVIICLVQMRFLLILLKLLILILLMLWNFLSREPTQHLYLMAWIPLAAPPVKIKHTHTTYSRTVHVKHCALIRHTCYSLGFLMFASKRNSQSCPFWNSLGKKSLSECEVRFCLSGPSHLFMQGQNKWSWTEYKNVLSNVQRKTKMQTIRVTKHTENVQSEFICFFFVGRFALFCPPESEQ